MGKIRKRMFIIGIITLVGSLLGTLYAYKDGKTEHTYNGANIQKSVNDPFVMDQGPEIEFVDGVPIFPWARPVVILQGSDFKMGYQYARQLSQIFGSWILELINCEFTEGQKKALKGYEWYIKKYSPKMIEFIKGMVEGAKDSNVMLTYDQVLAQFCVVSRYEL